MSPDIITGDVMCEVWQFSQTKIFVVVPSGKWIDLNSFGMNMMHYCKLNKNKSVILKLLTGIHIIYDLDNQRRKSGFHL